jgi:hypothetical protein
MKKMEKKELINVPYYEVISYNFKKDVKHIYNLLSTRYKIKVKEYYPFFQFTDKKIEFLYNNNIILTVYNNNERCVVYKYSNKKRTYFGTFNLILLYLLINYYYKLINASIKKAELYMILFIKLWFYRNKYLDSHNITVLDKSPFQDFTYECLGTPIHPIRASCLENIKKKKFKYKPSGKSINSIDYVFDNISGNQILNEKYLILKK